MGTLKFLKKAAGEGAISYPPLQVLTTEASKPLSIPQAPDPPYGRRLRDRESDGIVQPLDILHQLPYYSRH